MAQVSTRGYLFYLVGPSGAGKDSLLDWLRQQPCMQQLYFAPRTISRPCDNGIEQHQYLPAAEFVTQSHRFALQWQANGHRYGIDKQILERLAQGQSVLVNGSRAEIAQAKRVAGEQLKVILINVSATTLATRLAQRGREDHQQIAHRLARHQHLQHCPADIVIDNNTSLEHAGNLLLTYIKQTCDAMHTTASSCSRC